MKETLQGGYLAPQIEVINVGFGQDILVASGGFTVSNGQVTSGDDDDVWEE